ncbi:MAG TPA: rhomboid family intramembrane serine protease [Candidatus Sulfotelmatobacter sp.]
MLPLRDDQPSFSTPFINYFLIGLNLLIFLFESSLDPDSLKIFFNQFAIIPSHLSASLAGSSHYSLLAVVLPFFTSMFLHGGWAHVIGNMWFLYIFGDNVEDYLGPFNYLTFYLGTGLIAMACQVAMDIHSQVPNLGASGAIAGVLGAYFVLYPRARVLTWIFVLVLYLPAWVILGYWFVLQFVSGTVTSIAYEGRSMGGVAFWAHVGGFVAGVALIRLFRQRPRRLPYPIR